ncbi:hypothetical protein AVEN_10733-1 [Araneus ventricosus]|uniref:Uncharacterized protein n=1 Tax=Araneus ventricosus TaxID=182803 RepID=A0A4Y2G284_ARAVE|nr:hypothetical protein AVEN_10733-1 [Araneus ventricosus]
MNTKVPKEAWRRGPSSFSCKGRTSSPIMQLCSEITGRRFSETGEGSETFPSDSSGAGPVATDFWGVASGSTPCCSTHAATEQLTQEWMHTLRGLGHSVNESWLSLYFISLFEP